MPLKNKEALASLPPEIREELSYRIPMRVREKFYFTHGWLFDGPARDVYSVCPRCGISMDCDYHKFCCYCGQKLDWRGYEQTKALKWEDWRKERDRKEGERKNGKRKK